MGLVVRSAVVSTGVLCTYYGKGDMLKENKKNERNSLEIKISAL
jgi:hypothetical protein